MTKYVTVLGSIIVLLFSSCSLFDGNRGGDLHRPWELSALFDENGTQIALFEGELHTVRFTNEEIFNGETSCNEHGGNYSTRKSRLTVSNLVVTDEACREESHSNMFIDALANSKNYEVEEGTLTIFYGEQGRLVFLERLE